MTAAVAVVVALGAGVAGGSDAASPFDTPYDGNQPTLDRDAPVIAKKGATTSTRLSRSGSFVFAVGPFAESVRGTVTFTTANAVASRKRKLSFGRNPFQAQMGKRAQIRVKLGKKARRVLRRYRRLRVRAKVSVRDASFNYSERTLTFTLTRPR